MVGRTPRLLAPERCMPYFKSVGCNTDYISHPDEILAENFSRLILEQPVPDPWVLDGMARILA